MLVETHVVLSIVRGMARTSAVLFSAGTLAAGLAKWKRWSAPAYRGLCLSHFLHYSAVVVYVQRTMGTAIFTSMHFVIAATFGAVMYALMVRLAIGDDKPHGVSIGVLGIAFTVAYVSRTARHWAFAPMLLLVLISLTAYYRTRFLGRGSRRSAAGA